MAFVNNGRPDSSFLWDYFVHEAMKGKSKCTVIICDRKICGKELVGRFSLNLKSHLKVCHPDSYKQLEVKKIRHQNMFPKTFISQLYKVT